MLNVWRYNALMTRSIKTSSVYAWRSTRLTPVKKSTARKSTVTSYVIAVISRLCSGLSKFRVADLQLNSADYISLSNFSHRLNNNFTVLITYTTLWYCASKDKLVTSCYCTTDGQSCKYFTASEQHVKFSIPQKSKKNFLSVYRGDSTFSRILKN